MIAVSLAGQCKKSRLSHRRAVRSAIAAVRALTVTRSAEDIACVTACHIPTEIVGAL